MTESATVDAELAEYLWEHYRYEINMLRYSFAVLHFADGNELNVVFESCALHARVLRDFYAGAKNPANAKDDRVACEYGVDLVVVPDEIDLGFKKINKQIAHLDRNRTGGVGPAKLSGAVLGRLVKWVEDNHKAFMSNCRQDAKAGWDESKLLPALQYAEVTHEQDR